MPRTKKRVRKNDNWADVGSPCMICFPEIYINMEGVTDMEMRDLIETELGKIEGWKTIRRDDSASIIIEHECGDSRSFHRWAVRRINRVIATCLKTKITVTPVKTGIPRRNGNHIVL